MGVPSFYRWLVEKYPKAKLIALENSNIPISSNRNGDFDNLYLDMNGIIHPCFHPEDSPPTSFEEVFKNVFEYIDRLFSIVRPRKLLYMAIDGVAPRAKMNQQRSRRFKAAKDMEDAEIEEERLRKEFLLEGKHVLPNVESEVTDSNVITPGTFFMHELAKALQMFAVQKLKNDPGWRNIKVILSDANVPGEGEHKIMSFIRLQRSCCGYNPNTRHCLYGLDADLVMLALATHEIHFSIIRESVIKTEQQLRCEALQSSLLVAESNPVDSKGQINEVDEKANEKTSIDKIHFEFLSISILRQYLEIDIEIHDVPESIKKIDFERIIDDFIFLCFFAGNDFLPHIPSLEIYEGAIDLLLYVYKSKFKNIGGHLVDMQRVQMQTNSKEKVDMQRTNTKEIYINLKRVEKFILLVGAFEEKIFKKRSELQDRKIKRILSQLADAKDEEQNEVYGLDASTPVNLKVGSLNDPVPPSSAEILTANDVDILTKNTKELKDMVKESLKKKSDLLINGGRVDKVRLGCNGWKERYYQQKFCVDSREEIESKRKDIVQSYKEGLCWVLLYYFSGVPSWNWYYAYHHGPFASDLKGLAQGQVNFEKGVPFYPFQQLMGVLPSRSAHALPKAYQPLMTGEGSNLEHFYPEDFEMDMDGKRFLWQGICLLPFIDEKRLLSETEKLTKDIEVDEAARNTVGPVQLFLRRSNPLWEEILLHDKKECCLIPINASLSEGLNGYIDLPSNTKDEDVVCVPYNLPDEKLHIPRPLEGSDFPEKIITESDIKETQLWHEVQGNNRSSQMNSQTQANRSDHSSRGFTGHGRADQSFRMDDRVAEPSFRGASRGYMGRGRSTSFHSSPNTYFGPTNRSYSQVIPRAFQPILPLNHARGFVNPASQSRPMPSQTRPRGAAETYMPGPVNNAVPHPWRQSVPPPPSYGARTLQQNPNPNFPQAAYGRGRYVPRNPSTITQEAPPYSGRGRQYAAGNFNPPSQAYGGRGGQYTPGNSNPSSQAYGGRGGQHAPGNFNPSSQAYGGRGGQYAPGHFNPSSQAYGGRGGQYAPGNSSQAYSVPRNLNSSSNSGWGSGGTRYVPKAPKTVTQKNSFSSLSQDE